MAGEGPGRDEVQAFTALYDAQFERLYHYLRYRLGDPALAEDLAAEVFSRAWLKWDTLRPGAAATGWLFTAARHLVADHYRRGPAALPLDAVPPERHPRGAPPDVGVLLDERVALVRRAVAGLGDRERAVVELHFVAGLRHREIAQALGTSEGNVAKILHRTLRRLRASLAHEEATDGQPTGQTVHATGDHR